MEKIQYKAEDSGIGKFSGTSALYLNVDCSNIKMLIRLWFGFASAERQNFSLQKNHGGANDEV